MAAEVRQFLSGRKGLTGAARQTKGLLLLPQALDSAISTFLEDYSSNDLKKNVSRLSASMRSLRSPATTKDAHAFIPDQEMDMDETGGSQAAREALDEFLSRRPTRSKRVRGNSEAQESVQYTEKSTAAYVAARMPAIYGAVHRVLSEVSRRVPDFRPSRMLDFGCGPGTALWATNEVWPGVVKKANIVEPSQAMAHACRSLLKGNNVLVAGQDLQNWPVIKPHPTLLELSRSVCGGQREHDLVIASYTLGELPTMEDRISIARRLWSFTSDILVLIEPGTPQGSATIREMRSHILQMERKKVRQQKHSATKVKTLGDNIASEGVAPTAVAKLCGAFVVAPCSHEGRCPMDGSSNWCHFVQRLQRTSLQRITKRNSVLPLRAYEDEKFSFVVLRRGLRSREPWPLDGLKSMEVSGQTTDSLQFQEFDPSDLTSEATDVDESSDDDMEFELSDFIENVDDSLEGEQVADLGSGWGRIVRPPLRRGRHVILDICQATERDGSKGALNRLTWTRKGTLSSYLKAKKLMWGDLWPC